MLLHINSMFHINMLVNIILVLPVVYARFGDVPGEYGYEGVHDGAERAKSFINEWSVEVEGGEEVAQLVALELGYIYGGPVIGFPDKYVFLKYDHAKQRRAPSRFTTTLVNDRRVKWAEQLFAKSRQKRYIIADPDLPIHRVKRIEDAAIEANSSTVEKRAISVDNKRLFNDELWAHQWYLQDTRTLEFLPRLDLNVLPVYEMGYNGKGVRVSVLDDGIEHTHSDLRDNYDPEISWDTNDGDPDPTPRYQVHMKNSHGTRCAGEIAMTANNHKCGVGVAWGAKVGGVRMLDGRITDRIEAESIGYAVDKVDIYSASWGPNDDGRTVEGPGRLAIQALKRGIIRGRGGKGSIYVWANGNGGGYKDNCNCDGYSSSIYTVAIGSASQHGLLPWYGEICSSTLATAYSSGAYKDQKIATTDTRDTCTLNHTGTSAAAPLAAGIIALALQANPNLTWRDVQHLIVWTSEYSPLSANPGWQTNGVGLRFDIRFGFGLINAGGLVTAALNWTTVPNKSICRISTSPTKGQSSLSSKGRVSVLIKVTEDCEVNYLEHVELVTNVRYSRRGALQIYSTSPSGTRIQLLSPRPLDISKAGFVNWPLMSVGTWGEDPKGEWEVTVEDETDEMNSGEIGSFTLIVHGTHEMPEHMRQQRIYRYKSNYQDVFNFFDNGGKVAADSVFNVVDPALESQNYGEIDVNEIDPLVLAQVEKELQRIRHQKTYNTLRQ